MLKVLAIFLVLLIFVIPGVWAEVYIENDYQYVSNDNTIHIVGEIINDSNTPLNQVTISAIIYSEENVIHINKSRTSFSTKLDFNLENLPLLENDTFAIIEHSNDIENYKKKKKNYIFYDLIKNDEKSDNQ